MIMKVLSNRILGIVSLLSGAIFFFLLVFPYYYLLGRQSYVPKSNPDFGYVIPKSPEAWFFLILALLFLAVSVISLGFFIRKGGGRRLNVGYAQMFKRLVPRSLSQFDPLILAFFCSALSTNF
jgi:hypothetical protein